MLEVAGPARPRRPGHEVVRGVDLEVRAGEILGIAGVAGNGQDELVEALIGLRPVAGGPVHAGGRDVTGLTAARHERGRASATCPPTATASG